MSVLNIPRDDLGLQRLEEANATRTATQPVAPLAASAPLGPHPAPARARTPVAPTEERRHGDRRRGRDRRQEGHPVLLDTRSPYRRRVQDRRYGAGARHRAAGLDVYS